MKAVQRWMCEYCHLLFTSEEECRNCEARHVKVEKMWPEYKEGEKHPRIINVRFGDGSVRRYLDEDYI